MARAIRHSMVTAWVLIGAALATAVCALLLPLAPVHQDDPVLSWPQAGGRAENTVVPLMPYRPLELTAELPCRTLASVDGDVLRTLPARPGQEPGRGLVVRANDGRLRISSSSTVLLDEARPTSGECAYQVRADAGGTSVLRDGVVLTQQAGLLPPQVAMFETAGVGHAATDGLKVTLHTDARFQSSPTATKAILLVLQGILLVGCTVLAVLRFGASRAGSRLRLSPVDAVVPAVLLGWTVLGPINEDDGWYLRHALNSANSGFIGNYYHSFNTSEAPFVVSQYLLGGWASISTSLLWLRLFAGVIGIGTWFLLRWFLASALGDRRVFRAVPWSLALAFLAWWLPFTPTLRPEPVAALGVAATLALCEYARRREWPGLIAPAVGIAALTTLTTVAGLVAWGAVLVQLPWLWRWLRTQAVRNRFAYVGAVLASGTTAFTAVFADAKFTDVVEATRVHYHYWISMHWYEEWFRYVKLLGFDHHGNWAKRAAVLLTLAALVFAAFRLRRRGRLDSTIVRLAVVVVVGLIALTLSPTKWSHHFLAIAPPAIALLGLSAFGIPAPRGSRALVPGLVTAALTAVTAVVIFAGPNLWYGFSDWGQPFGDHSSTIPTLALTPEQTADLMARSAAMRPPLDSPLLWGAVLAACLLVAPRGRNGGWATTGSARLLVTVQAAAVVLLIAVFTIAPLRTPGWSVAGSVLRDDCGLADGVRLSGGEELMDVVRSRPASIDWEFGLVHPCAPTLAIADGLSTAPELRVLPAGRGLLAGVVQGGEFLGGTLGYLSQVVTRVEPVPTIGPPNDGSVPTWGEVQRVHYAHPVGKYTLTRTSRVVSGLEAAPTLAQTAYAGIPQDFLRTVQTGDAGRAAGQPR
ncbi:arabinosyltransferase domain-containing protein [Allokutzneria sp. A3M-2-11 16]|uniref:arabinosyltransferase domain-containing protein n=1 Tax=Allokutzneria sp. A3M-2-11 16 TaxID=2962043 RepID=UPI0020B773E2|nr:arabinosyltransferase domain-containing protein [Allokutzneria sp. A3M-2-11 16]MCP3799694.1 arabinosyltransferase domain-containing protein [Allokutzneria sp. A3M-2-11 16]